MGFEISICIPTYNKGAYIAQTLDSIINQLDDNSRSKIEICISDNASEDNTKEIIEKYQTQNPNIIYFRHDSNQGLDLNMIKSAELSRGKYRWLLGSDDMIAPGAINKALEAMKTSEDIYVFNMKECDAYMNDLNMTLKMFKPEVKSDFFRFETCADFINFTKSVTGFGLFGVLTSLIKKERWDNVKPDSACIGTSYIQVYYLFEMIKMKATLRYIDDCFLLHRSNVNANVSYFEQLDRYKRLRLDIVGYEQNARSSFHKNTAQYDAVNIFVINNIAFFAIISAKINNLSNISFCVKLLFLCLKFYHSYFVFWVKIVPAIATPGFMFKLLMYIYRKLKPRKN